MNLRRYLTLAALAAAVATFSITLADDHPKKNEHPKAEHPTKTEHPTKAEHPKALGDIVAVASGADSFKTLVSAFKAAGLVKTLQGEGPFTVFAPTDAAFAKVPPGMLDSLLKPENKEMLSAILAYHVVPGRIMAADVKTMKVMTVNGQEASIKVEKGNVTVDKAKVVKTDIAASNGVIHAIDAVLLPTVPAMNPAAAKPKDHPGH
ncbi:fasciclin domain-containing protein [Candidatus Eisenbacteria bacterium]|uniref:Fasciclin domain-containing protein n=1 Tax=Eiseniibacteriota bacterium TaxID=2212470 RepID=A0ABV6YKR7_UNCEI